MRVLPDKFANKEYRSAAVEAHVRRRLAYQIKHLRESLGLSQKAFADRLGKPQSTVSRYEDPYYGRLTVSSLIEIANALDVALSVKFISFEDFIAQSADVSETAMAVDPYRLRTFPSAEGNTEAMYCILSKSMPPLLPRPTPAFYGSAIQ